MSKVDFNKFTWFAPKPKCQLIVTISSQNTMYLSPKLMEEIPAQIIIGVSERGDELCLREVKDSGYRLPKSGKIHDIELIRHIHTLGVRFPAKYAVRKEDDCCLATLNERVLPKVNTAKPAQSPRKRNLKGLLEEEKKL